MQRGDNTQRFSYGELVADQQLLRISANAAALKEPAEYSVIGQALHRRDIPAKLTGEPIYANDLRLDGMLYGRVVRPPAIGATITSVDLEAARALPGVVTVLQLGEFVGLAAESTAQAARALSALNISWQLPEPTSAAARSGNAAGGRS
ncbi:hypothetical protein HC891_23845 [Candidatus Gracilibacteria bacterium]|nr:hypothetical protein [Candidatus Gracilibacteria bacterium]